jgi:hypothetical protein
MLAKEKQSEKETDSGTNVKEKKIFSTNSGIQVAGSGFERRSASGKVRLQG